MMLHVSYMKHMDPISINSRKTCGPYWHQQQKNTQTLSAPTAQKHMDHHQHQQQKNTWTTISTNCRKTHGPLSASTAEKHMDLRINSKKKTWTTAEKHMDLISINSRKTHGPHQHKNTWMLSAPTAQKHMDAINIKASSRMSMQATNLGPPIWEEEKKKKKEKKKRAISEMPMALEETTSVIKPEAYGGPTCLGSKWLLG